MAIRHAQKAAASIPGAWGIMGALPVSINVLPLLMVYTFFMKRFFLVLAFFCVSAVGFTQDTLTVMTYNLLNYPNTNATRYNDLKQIITYTKPDIFICSEITDVSAVNLLLNNSFNVSPVNYYDHCNFVDGYDTDNMLYYNTNKLTLAGQHQIVTALRDISHYRLYSCESTDTVWYDVFSLHLKASSGITNANDRLAESIVLTNYIGTLPTNTNIIVGGDFNFYSILPSEEPAWNQLTVTCSQPLKDPINMAGEWHANSFYKNIHTQSTRSSTNPGCCGGSTGGMDDRFDFLLINQNLRDGVAGAKYISGTYKTIGQDGNHYNKSIIESPTNSSVPSNVNTALFNMSDHLPVLMKLVTCDATIGIEENEAASPVGLSFPTQEQMLIQINYTHAEEVRAEVYTLAGSVVVTENFMSTPGTNQWMVELPSLVKGMYVLRLSSASGVLVKKFLY
jgi:hypothetical protein